MEKKILPKELAEIVTGLLVKPELLGELDTTEKHQQFIQAVGQVVADFCGGDIAGVTNDSVPALRVSPNDNLPSITENVWQYHDVDAWAEVLVDSKYSAVAIRREAIDNKRQELQTLLSAKALKLGKVQNFSWMISDWLGNDELHPTTEKNKFLARCKLGNQTFFEIIDSNGENQFGVVIEIDKGVPSIHIERNEIMFTHIHVVEDSLIISPDNGYFESAEVSEYTYNESDSLVIRIGEEK